MNTFGLTFASLLLVAALCLFSAGQSPSLSRLLLAEDDEAVSNQIVSFEVRPANLLHTYLLIFCTCHYALLSFFQNRLH